MTRPADSVDIYTDGACSGNPGPGGWAAILVARGVEKTISGYDAATTNNRMELTAALEALKQLKRPCRVSLYSDSAYLVSAFTRGWLDNWQRNGWRNSAKDPVSNADLWQQLLQAAAIHEIEWIKVRGHADHAYNNRCDQMAVAQIRQRQQDRQPVPVSPSDAPDQAGSAHICPGDPMTRQED